MKAQELFDQLGYQRQEDDKFIQYSLVKTLDADLRVVKKVYITFDKLKGYYYIEGVDSGKAAITKLTAPLHYAIHKQVLELGWIE